MRKVTPSTRRGWKASQGSYRKRIEYHKGKEKKQRANLHIFSLFIFQCVCLAFCLPCHLLLIHGLLVAMYHRDWPIKWRISLADNSWTNVRKNRDTIHHNNDNDKDNKTAEKFMRFRENPCIDRKKKRQKIRNFFLRNQKEKLRPHPLSSNRRISQRYIVFVN